MYPKEYMWTMRDTVEITMSIMTEIGSRRKPMSIWRFSVNGSHTAFQATCVGKTPLASLPAPKYDMAVQ